jgi:co-chaperonin GroES (HSP10)
MSKLTKFTPGRGKFALKKDSVDGKTSTGIVYTPKENPHFASGVVAAIGEPSIRDNGIVVPFDIPAGTRVLVSKEHGYDAFGEFMLFQQKCVVAILDKDTKLG